MNKITYCFSRGRRLVTQKRGSVLMLGLVILLSYCCSSHLIGQFYHFQSFLSSSHYCFIYFGGGNICLIISVVVSILIFFKMVQVMSFSYNCLFSIVNRIYLFYGNMFLWINYNRMSQKRHYYSFFVKQFNYLYCNNLESIYSICRVGVMETSMLLGGENLIYIFFYSLHITEFF